MTVYVQTAVALSHAKRAFIGAVKTAHSLYPKKYIENVLGPLPAGARIVLEGTVDGVQLLAIGYKYNRRKVLCFVATKGAGVTTNAQPYLQSLQRWADIHGNVITKEIPRPAIISEYFSVSPKIDNHNQSRQSDLALEECWLTQDCWFRLHTTVQGMVVTDAWKLLKHHLSGRHRMAQQTIKDFADELSYALLTNGLRDSAGRLRQVRPARDGTAPPVGHLASRAEQPPPPPPANQHFARQHKRAAPGKVKQGRCRWCLVKNSKESWTTYFCNACGIDICVPGAHGRDCWERHILALPAELADIKGRARARGLHPAADEH